MRHFFPLSRFFVEIFACGYANLLCTLSFNEIRNLNPNYNLGNPMLHQAEHNQALVHSSSAQLLHYIVLIYTLKSSSPLIPLTTQSEIEITYPKTNMK